MTKNLPESAALRAMRSDGFGYLRAIVTVLVVVHHAALAYHPYGPPPPKALVDPMVWAAFPVVDPIKVPGLDALVGFNDVFFMSLMFLLSGLFAWPSLQRKGPGQFLRDRAFRLGVPFVVSAALLAPIAYYPAWLQSGGSGISGYLRALGALAAWPSGPAWFLWVLLVFGTVAAALHRFIPGAIPALGRVAASTATPLRSLLLLLAISSAAYLPMELTFGGLRWFTVGPFAVQSARPLHYLVYFLAGIAISAAGLKSGLLAAGGALWRRRRAFWTATPIAFILFAVAVISAFSALAKGSLPLGLELAADLAFTLSCATSSFAFLAQSSVDTQSRPVLDSLSDNAFGIYLTHYAFVSWLQYALLSASLPAAVKFLLVSGGALALSWATTALLRRAPMVARVISVGAPRAAG